MARKVLAPYDLLVLNWNWKEREKQREAATYQLDGLVDLEHAVLALLCSLGHAFLGFALVDLNVFYGKFNFVDLDAK